MGTNYRHVFIPSGSNEMITFSLEPRLGSGELLTGTPVVSDVTDDGSATGDLTIGTPQVNSVAFPAEDIAIGQAVQFIVTTSATVSTKYLLKIVASKDTGDGQAPADYLWLTFDKPCE